MITIHINISETNKPIKKEHFDEQDFRTRIALLRNELSTAHERNDRQYDSITELRKESDELKSVNANLHQHVLDLENKIRILEDDRRRGDEALNKERGARLTLETNGNVKDEAHQRTVDGLRTIISNLTNTNNQHVDYEKYLRDLTDDRPVDFKGFVDGVANGSIKLNIKHADHDDDGKI